MPHPPIFVADDKTAYVKPVRRALTDADYARVVWHVGASAFDRMRDDQPNVVWHIGASAIHRMRDDQPDLVLLNLREAHRQAALNHIEQERHALERLAAQLVAAKATARAIAHALNQPLAVIRGVTELIQTAPPGESHAADLAQILAATDRAAALVRDLMRVARYTIQLAADGNPMLDLSSAIDPLVVLE